MTGPSRGIRANAVDVDQHVPALVVKVGRYPIHAGGLGVARSLGRLGVPVHVITEDPFTPLAVSRYRARRFAWPDPDPGRPEALVAGLIEFGNRIGTRSVAIPTDDEAAILLTDHARVLSEHFYIPDVRPGLLRKLASKQQLFLLCREHAVPTPATSVVSSRAELLSYSRNAAFPLVVKNADPWIRLCAPIVGSTRVLRTRDELVALANSRHEEFRLIVQEHLPEEHAQDWFVHAYFGANSACVVRFTGVKTHSWPVGGGVTACGYSVLNPALADLTERFCKAIGYHGVADLDWRFDRRDGQYKLVDFNPRVGAQFALFSTSTELDVVRALHLDLTARNIAVGEQIYGRRIVVEPFYLTARLLGRNAPAAAPALAGPRATTVFGIGARDDPLPFVAVWPRLVWPTIVRLARLLLPRRMLSRQPAAAPDAPGVA
jgi:D-aspartate ligase